MKVISKLVKIKNNNSPSVAYIEGELKSMDINPLRWAVVEVTDENYTISVADLVQNS